ncbi:MAG: hypothetical protein WC783_04385 [Candidatus Paceibacterota bacterium]
MRIILQCANITDITDNKNSIEYISSVYTGIDTFIEYSTESGFKKNKEESDVQSSK